MTTPSLSSTTIPSILTILISEKLTKSNYPLWSAQVLPTIRAAQLQDRLTGDEKPPEKDVIVTVEGKSATQHNLAYTAWMLRNQAILGYLLSSLTHETLMHVSRCTMLAQAWRMLADLYSSQSHPRAVNTWIALMMTKKLQLFMSDYYSKMSQYADELAAIGDPLCHDEFITYLLTVLDEEHNPVFTAIVARSDPISPSELFAQLLSF
jgi:hypothetical protein